MDAPPGREEDHVTERLEILERLSTCVELGKVNKAAPYPPKLKGQLGADELCREAIDSGIPPGDILARASSPEWRASASDSARGRRSSPRCSSPRVP